MMKILAVDHLEGVLAELRLESLELNENLLFVVWINASTQSPESPVIYYHLNCAYNPQKRSKNLTHSLNEQSIL